MTKNNTGSGEILGNLILLLWYCILML